jgi:outer membrane protein assembly factor BamB
MRLVWVIVILCLANGVAAIGRTPARQAVPRRVPRLKAVVALPGVAGTIDFDRQRIYQLLPSRTRSDAIGFQLPQRRLLWKTTVEPYFRPVGVAASVVVCARTAGPETWPLSIGLDRETGRVLWKTADDVDSQEGEAGYTFDKDLIFQTTTRSVRCLEPMTGKPVWETAYDKSFRGGPWPHPPVLLGDAVYAQIMRHVLALNKRNGKERWRKTFPWSVDLEGGNPHEVGPVTADSDRVIAVIPTGPQKQVPRSSFLLAPPSALCCWRAQDGKQLWQHVVQWTNEPLMADNGLVAVFHGKQISAYSVRTGQERWRFTDAVGVLIGPWKLVQGNILVSELRDHRAYLIVIDGVHGQLKWRVRLPGAKYISSITPRPGTREVYVIGGDDISRLYIIAGLEAGR